MTQSALTFSGPQYSDVYRRKLLLFAALALLALTVSLSILHLSPGDLLRLLVTGKISDLDYLLVTRFRLPRLLMAVMIGSGMALAGWAAQKSTRNPLASPDILAVPAAAGLGVMVVLCVSGGKILGSYVIPIVATGSGVLASWLMFLLVGRKRGLDGSGFLLIGIALGALLSAATFMIHLNAPQGANTYQFAMTWMSGQLSRASWDYVWLLLPAWWFLSLAIRFFAPRLLILQFEDQVVTELGGHPRRWRMMGLALASALCACCVGVGGGFGFIGFVAPHIARGISTRTGDSPLAVACLGAMLLLVADALGQYVFWPDQVPAGIIIAMLGAPCYVIFMFWRSPLRKKWS